MQAERSGEAGIKALWDWFIEEREAEHKAKKKSEAV